MENVVNVNTILSKDNRGMSQRVHREYMHESRADAVQQGASAQHDGADRLATAGNHMAMRTTGAYVATTSTSCSIVGK